LGRVWHFRLEIGLARVSQVAEGFDDRSQDPASTESAQRSYSASHPPMLETLCTRGGAEVSQPWKSPSGNPCNLYPTKHPITRSEGHIEPSTVKRYTFLVTGPPPAREIPLLLYLFSLTPRVTQSSCYRGLQNNTAAGRGRLGQPHLQESAPCLFEPLLSAALRSGQQQ